MDLLIRLFPLQMSRPTCVLCFYLIGGLVAISFIVPDLMAQNYPDSQVWEKLKITIYLVSSSNEKNNKNIYRTRAIITRGLYSFYPLFEVHLCTVTFDLMYG